MTANRCTTRRIREMKGKKRIAVLTCYDFPTARILDRCGVEILLVGDSVGNVVLGYPNTIPVTLDEMIHHTKAVMRASPSALVVVDLPFGTFQVGVEATMEAAIRVLKETGADAVKLEGGTRNVETIRRLTAAGVPVMGHLGLTPQSVLEFGGYRLRGKGSEAEVLLDDARRIAEAGCFSMVLETVPRALARRITEAVAVPTIGIGAGPDCDGQVLVLHDMLGLFEEFQPKFVKRYAQLAGTIEEAVRAFRREVEEGEFPDADHSFGDPGA
ncbi:MAG: 3-methyl-2-oxobutanoate hydroxymethyltransferase [Candidatus Eisenbacteria bacterium]|nr:3-methyl-2-oxobutanoate hydroxymethyltransferase [Candidatus Latescibacterota bacterium]MBD3301936.1 3-methyl-2-oxobutanoate hydroxymethyltransferase [Candidatus Eisenbacteria bacterium]